VPRGAAIPPAQRPALRPLEIPHGPGKTPAGLALRREKVHRGCIRRRQADGIPGPVAAAFRRAERQSDDGDPGHGHRADGGNQVQARDRPKQGSRGEQQIVEAQNRDIEQIAFCVKDNWEFVAASFVRNAEDVRTVRKHLEGSSTRLISKIEDQQGADNFDEILKESDGIMVARGDMGAEIPIERILQKEFIYKCNQAAKPVITATNMLESMIEKPLPTRAEITDVANAVLDGTDALMTSGETSGGKYPLESVETMSKIAVENEKYLLPDIMDALQLDDHYVGVAMANAAFQVAENIELDKILVVSVSGTSARLLARHNLHMPILAFVSNPLFKNQLAMTKGIKAFVFPESYSDRDSALHGIITFALEQKLIDKTDKILLVGRGPKSGEDKHYFPNIFEYVELSKF